MSSKDKLTKSQINIGIKSGQISYKSSKSKNRKGYEIRITAENSFESQTYPGFDDHPSEEGTVEYLKHVDTSDAATVWQAVANEHYARGGIPCWLKDSLSDLEISLYWQLAHYQMVWGGTARPSYKTLSRNLGCRYRSVQRGIARLLETGVVKLVKKNAGRRPNVFRVVLFSELEPQGAIPRGKKDSVEVTDGEVEATGEATLDDSVVTQKTKPLKGRVAGAPANAALSTTRKKKSDALLQTIGEASVSRHKKIAQSNSIARPGVFRSFHLHEVSEERILSVLNDVEFLAGNWEIAKKIASKSGKIDYENLTILPAKEHQDAGLFIYCQKILTSQKYDITNLPKALDLTLRGYLVTQQKLAKDLESELNLSRRRREDEEHRELERQAKEKERLSEIYKKRLFISDQLTTAHKFLSHEIPNFANLEDSWGSVSNLLCELQVGGKENARLSGLKSEVARVVSQVEDLSKEWLALEPASEVNGNQEDLFSKWYKDGGISPYPL